MRRPAGLLLLISSCVGCGPSAPGPPSAAVAASAPTFDLLAWEYPGARPIARFDPILLASGKVGREEIAAEPRVHERVRAPALYAYDTPDPLEAVYAFYGRKLGLDPEYRPASLGFQEDHWDDQTRFSYPARAAYPTLRFAYTGPSGRQDVVRTATLVGPGGPGFSVTVVLSRAQPEGSTTVELVVTRGG